jgi:hypothetical protein
MGEANWGLGVRNCLNDGGGRGGLKFDDYFTRSGLMATHVLRRTLGINRKCSCKQD